jgi:yeast amino acid transporter
MASDYKNTSPSIESPTAYESNGHVNPTDRERIDPESGVKRGLKTRHLSMLALAGIIGPGLLVGAGGALNNGGPASLIIGFGVIGIIAFSIMQSLGELTTLYPSGGAFTSLADRFVDKAFGVSVGWNYWIIWVAVRKRRECKLEEDWLTFDQRSWPTSTMSSHLCSCTGATRSLSGDTS